MDHESTATPGLYADIPINDYHAMPGCSQSMLKVLGERSPAHLKWELEHPQPPTAAQILGAAVHDCVLLPEAFARNWVRGVEGDGRTKAVREARAALAEEYPNATILRAEDYDTCTAIRAAIAAHPRARRLLIGDPEQSVWWYDPDTEVLCKGRFDLLGRKSGALVDLKTCMSAARDAFSRTIWSYGYYMQAAHYLAGAAALGLECDRFAFIAVEKSPPYGIALYELSRPAIEDGERLRRPLLELYAACAETDEWPSYPETVEIIDVPRWAPGQINDQLENIDASE